MDLLIDVAAELRKSMSKQPDVEQDFSKEDTANKEEDITASHLRRLHLHHENHVSSVCFCHLNTVKELVMSNTVKELVITNDTGNYAYNEPVFRHLYLEKCIECNGFEERDKWMIALVRRSASVCATPLQGLLLLQRRHLHHHENHVCADSAYNEPKKCIDCRFILGFEERDKWMIALVPRRMAHGREAVDDCLGQVLERWKFDMMTSAKGVDDDEWEISKNDVTTLVLGDAAQSSTGEDRFYADSGANIHATGTRKLVSKLTKDKAGILVKTANNGSFLRSHGCGTVITEDYTLAPNSIDHGGDYTNSTWLMATAALQNATGNRDFLTDFTTMSDLFVKAGDGVSMPVCGRGSVITDTVVLPDVWFVPGLTENLVSAGQLTELGYSVDFARDACFVRSATDGTVIGKAHVSEDGLFEIDFLKVGPVI